jgi:putative component of toxin-antitoxin plasmid stabilization module
MIEIRETEIYSRWFKSLRDREAGGDKRTQDRAIKTALDLSENL